ncbi:MULTISPECIES: hypothetical protein [unclassified Novosphingobium]|nr:MULTISPECIES: hypothetical protein [unclassified Novosphingobium]
MELEIAGLAVKISRGADAGVIDAAIEALRLRDDRACCRCAC